MLPDFSDDTAAALRCHGIEPTFADVQDYVMDRKWKYVIELVDGEDGLTHMASIHGWWRGRFATLGRGECVDLCEALAGALVYVLDSRQRLHGERPVTVPPELSYVPVYPFP